MAIQQIRLPDGTEVILDEWLHWPQYSTIEFAAGAVLNLSAFSYVVGGRVATQGLPSRTALISDTNQTTATRMNHDEAFLAYGITYEAFGLTDQTIAGPPAVLTTPAPAVSSANLRRLQRDVVVSFKLGANISKPQFRAPLSWIGQGVGSPAFGVGDAPVAGVAFNYGTAGDITPASQRQWRLPIFVASDRVMRLQVQSHPSGAGNDPTTQAIRMRFYLDGLKRRPIA